MPGELEQTNAYETVTLVDRVGTGGCEFVFDGKRFVFKPGKPQLAVPRFVAEWLFKVTQSHVHTTDGRFLCRYGIADGPEDLAEVLGAEALDTERIVVDTTRVEGWDAETADPTRARARTIQLKANPADFRRDGGPAVPTTFGGKKEK